jgi:hypothetical protein
MADYAPAKYLRGLGAPTGTVPYRTGYVQNIILRDTVQDTVCIPTPIFRAYCTFGARSLKVAAAERLNPY